MTAVSPGPASAVAVSDEAGEYVLDLPAGAYTVTFTLDGFAPGGART